MKSIKRIGFCMTIVAALVVIGLVGSVKADDGGTWSVAPKLIGFIPNNSDVGLNNFSTGFGIGVDARYNVIKYFAVAPELDYIGISSHTTDGVTANFSTFAIKVDALGMYPVGIFTPFLGLGLVYNINSEIDLSGGGLPSGEYTNGSGLGYEFVIGSDFKVTHKGAIAVEISIPMSQLISLNQVSNTNVNVGGYELLVGYRFYL